MIHLGDITKIHGCTAPIVDCIIGGSPCQDLSIAGKRAGLAGERSGLYMEQIRIIREMREHDRANGRTGEFIRPRYMVWENVPGAFSSNGGRDFQSVLTETVRVIEPEAPVVPMPEKGWPTSGCLVGNGWSIAWRVLDAQFWGVPQRRRRIVLIADFGGKSAPEILFIRESLSGGSEPGRAQREAPSADAGKNAENPVWCLQGNGIDRSDTAGCNGRGWKQDISYTLNTIDRPAVCAAFSVRRNETVRRITPLECERLQGFHARKEIDIRKMTKDEYIAWNLQCGNIVADPRSGKVFTTRGPGGGSLSKPKELLGSTVNGYKVVSIRNGTTKLQCRIHRIIWISANGVIPNGYCIDHINNDKQDNRLSNLQLLTPIENSHKAKEDGLYKTGEDNKATKISPELYDEIAYLYATDDFTMRELAEVYGISKSRISQIIKETGWTDIGAWTDSKGKLHKESSDSARYKALGNSIALPPWKWVLKRLCAQYERDATMASLFDGIGGFPLIWEQLNGKGSCLWASEIEEFPIAVTKYHFGENG